MNIITVKDATSLFDTSTFKTPVIRGVQNGMLIIFRSKRACNWKMEKIECGVAAGCLCRL